MLFDFFNNGYLYKEDWNCSEHLVAGANYAYKLGLDEKAIKLAAGFGGGMAIGSICGALTGAIMVLGVLFVKERAHESDKIKELTKELFERYTKSMGDIDCLPLKDKYRTEQIRCRIVILEAARILDDIIARELPGFVAKLG